MEIDEIAARLVRQYWAMLVICMVVPLAVVGALVARQPVMYAAQARIIASSEVPVDAAAADSVVSQVQGIATGPTAASQALKDAGVSANVGSFIAHDIAVAGLGTSQVVELSVTDADPVVAQKVSRALAEQVVSALNRVGGSGLAAALRATDAEIVVLSERRAALAAQVAGERPPSQQLQAKLAGLDQVIGNYTGDRGRLLIQASTQGLAAVIDQPQLPTQPESTALPQKLGLATLLGLVLGILLAAIAETIRPTVPGSQRVSRRLSAPTLGRLNDDDLCGQHSPGAGNLAHRIRLAASHADVSTVALVDLDGKRDLAELARELEDAMLRAQAARPADVVPGPAADGNGGATNGSSPGASTLVLDKLSAARSSVLHVRALADAESETGRVGLVVLSGPVARVSHVSALDDLAVSSGWPVLGVVGVPRLGRVPAFRDGGRLKQPARFASRAVGGHSESGVE